MLTRKDYIAVARILQSSVDTEHHPEKTYLDRFAVVCAVADYCEQDNPNFDRDKFFEACYAENY